MKTKVIALVLMSILLTSIFPVFASAEKNIQIDPGRNILDQMKFPSKTGNSNGLVAHYKFDGNLNDSSNYRNDGKPIGNITYVKGKFGEAVKFDGKSYIEVLDDDSLDLETTFTISAWLYKEEVYDFLPVLAKGLEGADPEMGIGVPYLLYHDSAGSLPTLEIHSPNDWSSFAPYELDIAFNTLHMVTITMDIPNGDVNHYVNGRLVQSEKPEWYFTSDKLHNSYENLFIGCASVLYGEIDYFQGFMDDLRIYNRALSANEISALYVGEAQEQNGYVSMIITPDKMGIMKEKGVLYINTIGVKPDGLKEDITTKAIYSSSNENILTVDKQGKVVAIGKGTATIAVINGDLKNQILFTVK